MGNEASELGDGLVHRREISKVELGGRARRAPVAVDHLAGLVPRAVLDPCFRLSVRERDGDEGRAGVMDADGLACFRALEEARAIDASDGEVPAIAVGLVTVADARAAFVGENEVVVGHWDALAQTHDAEGAHRKHDSARERPCSRVVRFVLVKRDRTAPEVEVTPAQTHRFADARAFSMEEAIEDAPHERDGFGGEELGVFVGVQPAFGFAGWYLGEESGRQWVLRDKP